MENNFEKILNDKKINDVLCSSSYIKLMLHKEQYRDRFIILYTKNYKESIDQNNYEISGYYDTENKIIYNCSSNLKDLIPDDSKIKFDDFMSLSNKIVQEMEEYIKDYVLANAESFKDAAIARHNYDDNYRMSNYQRDVERDFITKINPTITLDTLNLRYRINREDFYYDKSLFEEYLFEPEKTIEKYSKIMMEKDKVDLGLNLLCYEAKKEYLDKINENKNNKYDHLYLNRKLLDAIRPAEARNINITIKYGDKEATFKYDYESLRDSLSRGEMKSNTYGPNYSKIRDFFSDNEIKGEDGRYETEFKFSNIISITHGKNVLYTKTELEKNIEKDDYEEEIER